MKGWLVNDTLTCIPGTKTLWHDLLENVPSLEDKTGGVTDFKHLKKSIESQAARLGTPDYIIRNATYFEPLRLKCKTYSLMQDIATGALREQQIQVCNGSTVTVFNSEYTMSLYLDVKTPKLLIPLGVDFDLFKPLEQRTSLRESLGILPDSVLFVGDASQIKGFDILQSIIDQTNFNFCLVMKDGYTCSNPRVRVFNRVPHSILVNVYNSCKLLLCTSRVETQHLSGLEAAACNLPVVASNVGCYFNRENGDWGRLVSGDFIGAIHDVFESYDSFSPRQYFLDHKYDKNSCMTRWRDLVEN